MDDVAYAERLPAEHSARGSTPAATGESGDLHAWVLEGLRKHGFEVRATKEVRHLFAEVYNKSPDGGVLHNSMHVRESMPESGVQDASADSARATGRIKIEVKGEPLGRALGWAARYQVFKRAVSRKRGADDGDRDASGRSAGPSNSTGSDGAPMLCTLNVTLPSATRTRTRVPCAVPLRRRSRNRMRCRSGQWRRARTLWRQRRVSTHRVRPARAVGASVLNEAAIAAAAAAGLLVDGVKLHALLLELSHVVAEAIARDDPAAHEDAFEPGGAQHVTYAKSKSKSTRTKRWTRIQAFLGRARRAVGDVDFSFMMGESIAGTLKPRGHGADARRTPVRDPQAFLDALLEDVAVRERLKRAIASKERTADHVQQCVQRKRLAHTSYDAIDQYRDMFLVKHPSRGAMVSATKKLVAFIYANCMVAGATYSTDDDVLESARLRVSQKAASDAALHEGADKLWLAFRKRVQIRALGDAKRRGERHRNGWNWLKVAGEWWGVDLSNPRYAAQRAADEAAAAEAETEAEPAHGRPEANDDDAGEEPMAADEEGEEGGEEEEGHAPALPDPETANSGDFWDLGGLVMAEVKNVTYKRDKVRVCFILELLKGQAHITSAHGRFGPAAIAELVRCILELEGPPVTEVALLVKRYENAATARARTPWKRTERAYDLYESVGFTRIASPAAHACMYPDYDPVCQEYMRVPLGTLRERLAALAGATLTDPARWVQRTTLRTRAPVRGADTRTWFDRRAVDALRDEHATQNGGDGADVEKDLVPKPHRYTQCVALFDCVPKPARETGADGANDGDDLDAYAHVRADIAGETVRVFDDDTPQHTFDGVETETAKDADGGVCESWGAMDVREVLAYLLLARLRGHVALSKMSRTVGTKIALDAACVRRAKRGHKHWTTMIVQILCAGVRDKRWGRDAVLSALQKANSPNMFAKIRVWNGKDNRPNFEAHVVCVVRHLLELQDTGVMVPEMLMPMPPVNITLGDEENNDVSAAHKAVLKPGTPDEATVGMQWHGGAEGWQAWLANAARGAAAREALVEGVMVYPSLNITLDGGTWLAASGVRATGERPSLFTNQSRTEATHPFEWVWLAAGDSVRAYCERHAPGDAAFLALAEWVMHAAADGKSGVAQMTRQHARVGLADLAAAADGGREGEGDEDDEDDEDVGLFRRTREQRIAERDAAVAANQRALDGAGGEVLTTWADSRTRAISPEHNQEAWLASFASRLTGELETLEAGVEGPRGRLGFEFPVGEDTFVRLPAVPEKLFSRTLTSAVWGDLPVLERACLCILHGGMRTAENWLTKLLTVRGRVRRTRAPQPRAPAPAPPCTLPKPERASTPRLRSFSRAATIGKDAE